ncbi:uncharacterized protein LOC132269709 [Cornus florida]|uniref:uncharacterized protein LOC132269709 n=1 Tax=Cornus florida TaxID=4283 RepID=UPI0028A1AB20|nr:uncharacterized protein LOC132269709 [Cornus florida]
MANGTDTEDYVVLSRVRPGLKREFAFALKSQSEYAGSIGRTRSRRPQNGSLDNGVLKNSSTKRLKSSVSKETKNDTEKHSIKDDSVTDMEISMNNEAINGSKVSDMIGDIGERVISLSDEDEPESDVVDLISDDEPKSTLVESLITAEEPKDEMKIPVEAGSIDEAKTNLVEAMSEKEPKNDLVEQMCKEAAEPEYQVKNFADKPPTDANLEKVDPPCNGKYSVEPAILTGNGIAENAMPGKPVSWAAGSASKSNVELVESAEVSLTEDVKTEEVAESETVSSLVTPANKLEMKMSKKISLKRFPPKLKELLDTGLLEGLPVRYIRGSKVRAPKETGLRGIIKGSGILCSCEMCGGAEVVTPNQFELHASSSNKRPPEYIYLENGNTLRDVLNACKDAPMDMLEVTIQNTIGCSSGNKPTICLNCKGSIPEAGTCKTVLFCDSCMALKECQPSPTQMSDTSDRSPMSIPKSSDKVSYSSSSRSKSHGRLTRKDLRMHRLVFEEDVLPDGTELGYYARGQKLLAGYKMGAGIYCTCCRSEVSPSQFESHAGFASRRKPYLHIYTSNGVSLHELSISLSKNRKFSAEENDDLCSICADGGDLLLCDTCPRAFHTECVSLPSIPNGTWYCKYCQNTFQKEKFVEHNANAVAAGRIAGIDPIEQITKRCIRIVETPDAAEVGGCLLCRQHDFSKSGFSPRTVIICDQCEKEYHVGCLKEHKMDDLKGLPEGKWFCCMECSRIHYALQKLVVSGEEKLPETLLNVIKKKHEEKSSENSASADLDLRWRLLSGKTTSDETRVLLSKAVAIFHDRFDPIADSNTSHLDLIPHMVYGRNLRDQEFGGMYCAILTANSSVVSAGIFRIFGQEVAELPLVATTIDCQGQGYFQSLFSCIENLLGSLHIKNLVLPAADEAESIWTKKFGFAKLAEDELNKYRKDYQMMVFQGTSMLHKPVAQVDEIKNL